MKKILIGIILFLIQISMALYYGASIDLIIIFGISVVGFAYILYHYFNKKYDSCEL
jgi:putative effector of murein hydrolase